MQSLEQLQNQFSLRTEHTCVDIIQGKGDIPVLEISNTQASARISLQGANVLSWVPKDQDEVIWVSKDATFAPGKSVRGGIPICWPWFGAHQSQADLPAHGFARTVFWKLLNCQEVSADQTRVEFELDVSTLAPHLQDMWPYATRLNYSLLIGKSLDLSLTTHNLGSQSLQITQALHTYFNIQNIESTLVKGLEGKEYLDKTLDFSRQQQTGALSIDSEVDRIYLQTTEDVIMDNGNRQIKLTQQGSESTVVWNPWQAVAEKMGDLGPEGYRQMLCVETANAADDMVEIPAGGSHCMQVVYQVTQ